MWSNKIKNIGPKIRITLLVGALVLLGFGYWDFSREIIPESAVDIAQSACDMTAVDQPSELTPNQQGALYACPMMCVPPVARAGRCPVCGMDLKPVAESRSTQNTDSSRIALSEAAIKLAEIRTAPVERKAMASEVRLFGRIDYDPAHMTKITAFMPGVVDRVYVKRAGQFVRWGDPLFDIYSSDLLETQAQLLEVMKTIPGFFAFQSGAPYTARDARVQLRKAPQTSESASPEVKAAQEKLAAIRYKLHILGLPKRDIDELMKIGEATGIATVYAPMFGQVIEHDAYEGTYVNTGTRILTIADPQFVWAKLDAYEADYPWIRLGQKVTFQTVAYPGETFEGKVVFVDPVFNSKTRTFSIGAISPDQGGRLKAGMLIRANIHAQMSADGTVANGRSDGSSAPLVIPVSAPLITGKRAVVYVAVPDEQGVFEGREVVLGPRSRDSYLVVSGLEEGERVVVNGNFKIDSAVQILAKSSMMDIEGGHSAAGCQLPGESRNMHEHYQATRLHSRMQPAATTDGSEPSGHLKSQHKNNNRHGRRRIEHSTIQRRKPGQYGNTTKKHLPLTAQ